jgi:hypothetical protein
MKWYDILGSTSTIMFSIAELSLASFNPSVFIRIFWLGIFEIIPFYSARAA